MDPGRKPRLAVIVGAGASVNGNAPSVWRLTEHVRALPSPQVIGELRPFNVIVDGTLQTIGASLLQPSEPAVRQIDRALRTIRDDFNFETILHAVEVLEPYVAARTLVGGLADVRPILTAFTDPTPRYDALMNWQLLWTLRWDIIRLIRERVIAGSDAARDNYLAGSNATLDMLREKFIVHALNLNYDDLFERSLTWQDGFPLEAEDRIAFDRSAYMAALLSDEHVMTHLHGSVRFGYSIDNSAGVAQTKPQREVIKYATTEAATATLFEPPTPGYTDDVIDDAAPIVSGANKVLKFTTAPYSYYYAALQQTLQQSRKILCIGYGFADPHVNNWIREAIAHHGEENIRLGVMDYRPDNGDWPLDMREAFREIRDCLKRGPLELEGPAAREFASSGNICLTLNGYPPRRDIARRIVEFLEDE